MDGREAKDHLYEAFARTAKEVAIPKRIELELMAQGERTVEALARATGMGVTNTSAHLQVLARSRLVATRGQGGKVVILDVRPAEEFEAGHIRGALPVPLADLDAALATLPRRPEIVAYCQAPTTCSPRRRSSGCGAMGTGPGGWSAACPSGVWPDVR